MNIDTLKRVLAEAKRDERHRTNAETRYWCDQYKQIATEALNALAKQEQEPVAWMFQHEETGRIMFVEAQQLEWGFEKGNPRLKKIGPVYTTPPERKPLTDEQSEALIEDLAEWSRHVEVDTAHESLEKHVRRVIAAHGIKGQP